MIIKVILCQISKDAGGISKTVDPFHVNCMGGDLHYHIIAVGRKHKRKKRVQLIRIGGGVFGGENFVPYHVLNRSDKSHLVTEMLKY